jgi:hypothetical protein
MMSTAGRNTVWGALAVAMACGTPGGGTPASGTPGGGFVGAPPEGFLFGAPFVPADGCAVGAPETLCWLAVSGPVRAGGLVIAFSARPGLVAFLGQHGVDCAARAGEEGVRIQFLRAGPAGASGSAGQLLLGRFPVSGDLSQLFDGTWWMVSATAVRLDGQCREVARPTVSGTVTLDYATGDRVKGAVDLVTDDGGRLAGPFEVRTCTAPIDACNLAELPYCAVACFP